MALSSALKRRERTVCTVHQDADKEDDLELKGANLQGSQRVSTDAMVLVATAIPKRSCVKLANALGLERIDLMFLTDELTDSTALKIINKWMQIKSKNATGRKLYNTLVEIGLRYIADEYALELIGQEVTNTELASQEERRNTHNVPAVRHQGHSLVSIFKATLVSLFALCALCVFSVGFQLTPSVKPFLSDMKRTPTLHPSVSTTANQLPKSTTAMAVKKSPLSKVANHLNQLYQRNVRNPLDRLSRTSIASVAIQQLQLSVVSRPKRFHPDGPSFKVERFVDISEVFSQLTEPEKPASPSPHGVMVYGVPGVGKTTNFLKALPYRWSTDELFAKMFQLVFAFSLELPQVQQANHWFDLLSTIGIDNKVKLEATAEFIDDHPEQVLFIFDAFDQGYSKCSEYMRSFMCGGILPSVRILVAGRATTEAMDFGNVCTNREVRLETFTLHQSVEFLKKCTDGLSEKESHELLRLIRNQDMNVPLYLLLICGIAGGLAGRKVPANQFSLFQESVILMFLRDRKKQVKKLISLNRSSFDKLPSIFQEDIEKLQLLAAASWMKSTSMYTSADLHNASISLEKMERIGLLLSQGLPDILTESSNMYKFHHQLFADFFTAAYFARMMLAAHTDKTLLISSSKQTTQLSHITSHDSSLPFFLCGAAQQRFHIEILQSIAPKLQINLVRNVPVVEISRRLCRCLQEMIPKKSSLISEQRYRRTIHDYQSSLATHIITQSAYTWKISHHQKLQIIINLPNPAVLGAVREVLLQKHGIEGWLTLSTTMDFSCDHVLALLQLLTTTDNGFISHLVIRPVDKDIMLGSCDLTATQLSGQPKWYSNSLSGKPSSVQSVLFHASTIRHFQIAVDIFRMLSMLFMRNLSCVQFSLETTAALSSASLAAAQKILHSFSNELAENKHIHTLLIPALASCSRKLGSTYANFSSSSTGRLQKHLHVVLQRVTSRGMLIVLETPLAYLCLQNVTHWTAARKEFFDLTVAHTEISTPDHAFCWKLIHARMVQGNLLTVPSTLLVGHLDQEKSARFALFQTHDLQQILHRLNVRAVLLYPATAEHKHNASWLYEVLHRIDGFIAHRKVGFCLRVFASEEQSQLTFSSNVEGVTLERTRYCLKRATPLSDHDISWLFRDLRNHMLEAYSPCVTMFHYHFQDDGYINNLYCNDRRLVRDVLVKLKRYPFSIKAFFRTTVGKHYTDADPPC